MFKIIMINVFFQHLFSLSNVHHSFSELEKIIIIFLEINMQIKQLFY
jgi:hypothetical protein